MSKRKRSQPDNSATPAVSAVHKTASWLRAHSVVAFLIFAGIASLRIVSTYTVFNHTVDEPAHFACGLEWLDKGVYRYETQHPPLARVAGAFLPYLAGVRSHGAQSRDQEGVLDLYTGDQYDRTLSLARLGILPFFWLAALVVFVWGRRYFGDLVAVVAAGLFTFLPPVLAHAGLATTDMPLTAFVGASFLAGLLWVETPNLRYSLLFGVCTGLAVLSKFSSLLFLPAAFATALVWYFCSERPGAGLVARSAMRRVLPFGLAVATGVLVIWAGYRFSYGKVDFTAIKLPAPELFDGIKTVLYHNEKGHKSYLLGRVNDHGWLYYYPVVLGVKTPLAFLALLFFGSAICLKQRRKNPASWLPLAFSLGILFFALFSRINIGVRHILPVYMGFSIVAAVGAVRMLEMVRPGGWAAWTLGLSVLWIMASSAIAHPDYIPYMNELAGSEREKVLIDSDLDWGQDMKRLAKRLREVGAREVAFNPFIIDYLEAKQGFPRINPMSPDAPSPGWNAASLTVMKLDRLGLGDDLPGLKLWTDGVKPTERLGYTTYLWYFPPQRGVSPRGQ